MPILLSHQNKPAVRLDQTRFSSEADLQAYIQAHPETIPLEDIKENVQFLILDREFPVSVGSIDALGIDSDGDLYIIETKLYKNPDKRQVVAQILDYGAALWSQVDKPEDWVRKLETRLAEKGQDLIERLEATFGQSDQVMEGMVKCLAAGSFQFIVLMDSVPSALKDLILYINQNSGFSLYAVELEYYVHQDIKILIPHVFGNEIKRKMVASTGTKRRNWDEISYFQDVEAHLSPEEMAAVRKLYDFSVKIADEMTWGTGITRGSFNPKVNAISTVSLYAVFSNGNLQFHYDWMQDTENALQWRDKLKAGLRTVPQIQNFIDSKPSRHPEILPGIWTPVVDELIQVLVESIQEFQNP